MPSLRLLTVNAHTLPAGVDGIVDLVSAETPDLVVVHAVPYLIRWRQAVGGLARRCGLVVVGGGGRESGSTLILSTLGVDVDSVGTLRLGRGGGVRPPGATTAALSHRGVRFRAAAVTLIGNSAERVAQVRELQAALDGLVPDDRPTLLSVEGTDRPGTAAWQAMLAGRTPVAGRVFADTRIPVGEVRELQGAPFTAPVVVDLTL